MTEWKMAVGDVASKEMGTGARANSGKPRWELMPISQVAEIIDCVSMISPSRISEIREGVDDVQMLTQIGHFQAGKCGSFDLLMMAVLYNWNKVDDAVGHPCTLMESLENVIKVWEFGLFKYAPFNWATGMDWSICIACMVRHTKDHLEGRDTDSESKELHSAHVVCNAMMLEHFRYYWTQGDDRPLFAFPKEETENMNSNS